MEYEIKETTKMYTKNTDLFYSVYFIFFFYKRQFIIQPQIVAFV